MVNNSYVNELESLINNYNEIKDDCYLSKIDKSMIFDNFYNEILNYFEIKLKEIILDFKHKYIDIDVDVDKILLSGMNSFRVDLISICKKVLISELYKMKENNQLIGSNSIDRYNYFDNLLNGKMKLKIIKENPVMAYLIINKISTKLEHIKECLYRFGSDYKEIYIKFNIHIKSLKRMILDEGDTHNNGKSVIILELNDALKVVYKPHSMDSDKSFKRLIDYVNSSNYFKYDLKVADSINKDNYGWQKFVEYKECKQEEEVRAYYYRVGVLIAIFNVIRAKDFHYENIIAHGEFPIPIDMETIISNRKTIFDKEDGLNLLSRNIAIEIENSIYNTLMIPQNLEMINFQVDMSGLNGGYNSEDSIEFSKVINIGTDDIGYQKIKGNIDSKQNRVKYNGRLVDIKDYVLDIVSGLDKGYEFIIDKREELIYLIKNNKIFTGKYRQVLRSTAKYIKFLEAAIHPMYTGNFEARQNIFKYLYGKNKLAKEVKARIDSEIKQLYRNDVPYFWVDFNSTDLYDTYGICATKYYDKTICELIIERIRLVNKLDKDKQILYLKSSIASLVKIQDSNKYNQSYPSNILSDVKENKFIDISKKIADYLEYICIWNTTKNKCSFMALNMQDNGLVKNGSLNKNLYEGAGIILFLATLAKITKDNKYIKIVDGILEGYNELYSNYKSSLNSIGVFTGISSLVYIYYNLWKIIGRESFYNKYKEILNEILILENFDCELDIINGYAGVSVLLSNIYLKEKDSLVLDIMKKLGKLLYSELKDTSKKYLTGFSHGYAGFSLALFALSYHLDNDEYYKLAKKLIEIENKYMDIKNSNWMDLRNNNNTDPVYWCHGAAGIALSRALSKSYLKEHEKGILDEDIEVGINKTLKDGFNMHINNSICHGTFGNLECLLVIAQKTKNKDLMRDVYNIANIECRKIIKNGIRCANPLKVETVNFMLGISGIGYELLRLHDASIPSVLILDVF